MTIASFAEVRLEDGLIIYGSDGGAEFNTTIVTVNSGAEFRNPQWTDALGVWDFGDRTMTDDALQSIVGFFRARMGKAQGFRFKDWADYSTLQTVTTLKNSTHQGVLGDGTNFGIGNGTAAYNTYKKYTSGISSVYRQIKKPVSGTFRAYKNGTLLVVGGGVGQYQYDTTTGILTFQGGSGYPTGSDTLTCAFEFDIPVRFDTDKIKYRFDAAVVATPGTSSTTATLGTKAFYLAPLPMVELRNP